MPRYAAFLRAINVGGRTVRKERLVEVFEELSFTNVSTFIASGNVWFETRSKNETRLVSRIEAHLESSLGFSVSTFLRTEEELAAIAGHKAFPAARVEAAGSFNVLFLSAPLAAGETAALMKLRSAIDDFHVHGREVYWLCVKTQSGSEFSNTAFERAVKVKTTIRGLGTLRRMLEARAAGPRAGTR
jgi:uncharacterized protein (DUF1697 family)